MRVAHELQAEISMNSSFEQGENVTSSPNGDWRLEIRDKRLEAAACLPAVDG